MKPRSILAALMFLLWSCNEVNDLQPMEPGTVSQAAIQIVTKSFPDAKDLTFKPLLDDKIWEVKFSSASEKYTSLVNDTKMWDTFRLVPDGLPAKLPEILKTTSFSGGTFSANSEDVSFYKTYDRRNGVIYSYNGTDYFLDWVRNAATGNVGTASFQFYKYILTSFQESDLPETIQAFLTSHVDLTFSTASVLIMPDYKKQFLISVTFKKGNDLILGQLLFDESGSLKWMNRAFNEPDVYTDESNIKVLPSKIQEYLDNAKELAGFYHQILPYEQWRGEYDGVSSYYIKLYNRGSAESCEMYFDKDENLLFKRYFVSFR